MDAVRHDVAAAIYVFAGWLTCRDEPITAGRTNDAAPMADLVDQFCKANGIPDPEMSGTVYKHPVGHCTGEGREMAAAARRNYFAARDFTPTFICTLLLGVRRRAIEIFLLAGSLGLVCFEVFTWLS